jgi:phage-related minor tail protein
MSDAKAAWDEVGNRFTELGKNVKGRYDANAVFGDDEREKVNDALRQIGDALDAGFTAIGDSIRDPAMRDELKGASVAVLDALTATFNDVAAEIRRSVKR